MSLPPEVVAADIAARAGAPVPEPRAAAEVEPFTDEEFREWAAAEQRSREREEKRQVQRSAALNMLRGWAKAHAKRDEVVRAAHGAGISVHRIHDITGIARTTITRIIASRDSGEPPA